MTKQVVSYLKWAGGKTRYADVLAGLRPPGWEGRVYREPFVGSAAVFFELAPATAVLSDANPELVVCHTAIRDDPEQVMARLDRMDRTKEFFAAVRSQDPGTLDTVERAARLIYLNKMCFRGLWRVNKRGQFNVPWGNYGTSRVLYDREVVLRSSRALQTAVIDELDFETAIDLADPGDFVYLDPPYVPLGGWADFKRYTPGQFHEADHRRMEVAMRRAADRGAHVMMTNSDTPLVREIWDGWHMWEMPTARDININPSKNARQSVDLVVTSYERPAVGRQLSLAV